MEYYEKRSLISLPLLITVYGSIYYDIYQYLYVQSGDPNNLNFWGNIFLELFLCLVLVYIIFYNAFNYYYKHKTGDSKPKVVDERDRQIEHKAIHTAYYILAGGTFVGLLSMISSETISPLLIATLSAFMASGISADIVRLVSYRSGH